MSGRFLVTTPIPDPGLPLLEENGQVTVLSHPPTRDELSELCASGDFDVAITQLRDPIDADLLYRARLKGICNYAVGFNNIDVSAATSGGILVANTPGVLTDATADITMTLILTTARRAVEADTFVRAGKFTGWEPDLLLGRDVSGATLGLAGFGRIARATARRAIAFGMDILFTPRPPHDRPVDDEELGEFSGRVTQAPWEEIVQRSDFLSLHLPLTEATTHLVNANVLRRMKSTSILINTARGPLVDETALVRTLQDEEIAAAGLDVYEQEPELAPGLADLPNTVLLPHLGSATGPVRSEMARLTSLNAIAIAGGTTPPHPVNPEALG